MVNPSNNLHRTFFHELGHFVAHIILRKHGLGWGIKKFYLKKDGDDYRGGVVPEPPEGWIADTPPPQERVAQSIFRVEHGCIFESYLLQSSLGYCAEIHGEDDYSKRANWLRMYQKSHLNSHLSKSIDNYLLRLRTNQILDGFLLLDPESYMNDEGEEIVIDHKRLEDDITEIVEKYSLMFINELNELRQILGT